MLLRDEQVRAIANEVLTVSLGGVGFSEADALSGIDHDGDDALFVTAHFRPGFDVTPGAASADAMVALRNRLLELGDRRFPYLRYDYPDSERPSDGDLGEIGELVTE